MDLVPRRLILHQVACTALVVFCLPPAALLRGSLAFKSWTRRRQGPPLGLRYSQRTPQPRVASTRPDPRPTTPPTSLPMGHADPASLPGINGTVVWPPSRLSNATPRDGDTAVCIAGGARSFHFRKVHESILHRAVERLRPARVFFVLNGLRRLDDHGEGQPIQKFVPMNWSRVEAAVAKFDPSYVELHQSGGGCREAHHLQPDRVCCEDNRIGGFMQLDWLARCLEVASDYEKRHGIRFGLWVRLRADMFYFEDWPNASHLRASAAITVTQKKKNEPGDWLFAVWPQAMNWFWRVHKIARTICLEKQACEAQFETLDAKSRDWCLLPNNIFEAPEYSTWFRQSKRAGTFWDGDNLWRFDDLDLAPIIVRTRTLADCFRSLRYYPQCSAISKGEGWD